MLWILMPVFLFTAAMAAGAAYFFARFLFAEIPLHTLAKVRNGVAIAGIVFPILYFTLFMLAQPTEKPEAAVTPDVAAIPAVWIGLILLGIATGLGLAHKYRLKHPHPPHQAKQVP